MADTRRLTVLGARIATAVAEQPLNGPVLIGLSGGADSAVLAWAFGENEVACRGLHVHHGWPASDSLAVSAGSVAAAVGIDLDTIHVDTDRPGSPEGVARHARYEALLAGRKDDEWVATAHTQTDQAETIVGNVMWGTGLDGLQGIRSVRGRIVRPLLGVTRSDVRELATLLGLPFVDDPSNDYVRFRRVRIRRALAAWESSLAPGVSERLAALPAAVREDIAYLDEAANAVVIESEGASVRLVRGVLRTEAPAIARRAVRRALRAIYADAPGARRDVEAVLGVAEHGGVTEISGGVPVRIDGPYVVLGSAESKPPERVSWSPLGELSHGVWTWSAELRNGRPDVYPMSPWIQLFDEEAMRASVVVRTVEGTDRLAMRTGHKSAIDALAERGVPTEDRQTWPVLEVNGDVVWLPGVRRAHTGWVEDGAGRYLVVSAQREVRWKPVEY
jgi:tRNA(Ile)-lysidine synthase